MSDTQPDIVYPPTQPDIVYPPTGLEQHSSNSKGSFGWLFMVLAILFVVSVIVCILGRIYARKFCHPKAREDHSSHGKVSNIEDGLKERIPENKPAPNEEIKEPKLTEIDESKSEIKPDDIEEAKVSA